MTLFDELETTMDSLVGVGVGGWVLGAIIVFALIFPIALTMLLSRSGGGSSGTILILMVSAFGVILNVGVGWWDAWSLVFIAIIILFGWWISRAGSGGGGL